MAFDSQKQDSFLLLKPTNLKKMTLSISKLMTTSARFIGLRASCPLMTALLIAVCGKANRANELGLVMGLVNAKSWHITVPYPRN